MAIDRAQTRSGRDFFAIHAPAAAIQRRLGRTPPQGRRGQSLVLDIEAGGGGAREIRVNGAVVPVIPFPAAAKGLVALATDDDAYDQGDDVELLLPRSAFDRVADHFGVARIHSLSLAPGAAHGDVVIAHLGACLEHALAPAVAANEATVSHISLALNLHVAQRYGGLKPRSLPEKGGLAPWQLRLACNRFDQNLETGVALEAVATECGLSASHFSRAFSRSTGLAPHRWLMHRRIERAKEMMLQGSLPLAQIAVGCGFADQSHFTRAFAAITGMTPGRWRAAEERACRTGLGGEAHCG